MTDTHTPAEVVLPVTDLKTEMPFFLNELGFRLETIFPADDPAVAVVSGHGMRLRLDRDAQNGPGLIRIYEDMKDPSAARTLTSPNGNLVEMHDANPPLVVPQTRHSFMVRRLADSDAWVIGRAGMRYRDLITDRLGGSIIASHIRIPDGGPVPDMVHYHTVGFQLIFCYRGWVKLVYEDQGEPFILEAGNCVIQPPQIRHRVLEASDNVEVLELGVPAEHITTIDHDMELPNGTVNPDREWQGTRFIHHKAAEAVWTPWRVPGWEARDTGIADATKNVAGVMVARPTKAAAPAWTSHDTDILFTFVKEGTLTLEVASEDAQPQKLVPGDAFVLPPFLKSRYIDASPDCELIEATLPANFETQVHD
ncbi:Cupin domain protein [Sulfitobacter noctilucicola]|uniref:Quercetin dioxygenase-like cupin family protein n=1 Tax=Sulfitobacter noctilucicola TaxID=1342301 RepID=A0A7W6MA87_9RHOB|nr:cupin domain-containing protein [Sulfitobacter noctilucicola]KIN63456.1 Cupin domain protein [Sulfitobacter noctilucicola]MBB4175032.1 quercetin dioxygenase-like cupin family protein [Sulfitobacter noctilucicola]